MRKALLDCCYIDWSKISPAIFGSMFQSVMNPKERRNLGAHYTSETNILKLIKPLFLDELWAEFETIRSVSETSGLKTEQVLQMHNAYLLLQNDRGYLLINQQNAHERILYERFMNAFSGKAIATQRSLFPATIDLSAAGNEKTALEKMLDQYKHFSTDLKFSKREKLLRSIALQQGIKAGISLTAKEMTALVTDLFSCDVPNSTPNGKPTYMSFKKEELDKMFGR